MARGWAEAYKLPTPDADGKLFGRSVLETLEQLRKRLALSGDAEGTIVLTRVAGHGTCLLVRPF